MPQENLSGRAIDFTAVFIITRKITSESNHANVVSMIMINNKLIQPYRSTSIRLYQLTVCAMSCIIWQPTEMLP